MTIIYFFVRYTPFWAIPLMLLGAEFTYIMWLRKKKRWVTFWSTLVVISIFSTGYYYWAGGPEKAVRKVMKLNHYYFQ